MATHKVIQQAEEALAGSNQLDNDLAKDLLMLAKALETALVEACRSNLELKAMDRNVAAAANSLRDATDALNRAYTQEVYIDEAELDRCLEAQIASARAMQ